MILEKAIKTSGFRSQRHKAIVNLMFTAYETKSRISQVLKQHGLTPEQYNVLRILKGSLPEPLCVRDIAGRLIERNSNVPRIADRLVSKKLAKRTVSLHDRRETLLHITREGMALLEVASHALEAEESQLMKLNETEASELNRLLELLMKA